MKPILIAMTIISMNFLFAQKCQDIRITDNCLKAGNIVQKTLSLRAKVSLVCETPNNKSYEQTISFKSVYSRAMANCERFTQLVSSGELSNLSQVSETVASLNNEGKIKTIGEDTKNSHHKRFETRPSAPSLSEAYKSRRQ